MDAQVILDIAKQIPVEDDSAVSLSVFYTPDGEIELISVYQHHREEIPGGELLSSMDSSQGIKIHYHHYYPEAKQQIEEEEV